jgi:hypothetical protein
MYTVNGIGWPATPDVDCACASGGGGPLTPFVFGSNISVGGLLPIAASRNGSI